MAEKEFLQAVKSRKIPDGFIKVTDKPVEKLSSEQKVYLNRKGNVLFNSGKINDAARIFITTGYSDGLSRVADFYMKKHKSLTAFKFYLLAKNKRKCMPLYEKIAATISVLLNER